MKRFIFITPIILIDKSFLISFPKDREKLEN